MRLQIAMGAEDREVAEVSWAVLTCIQYKAARPALGGPMERKKKSKRWPCLVPSLAEVAQTLTNN